MQLALSEARLHYNRISSHKRPVKNFGLKDVLLLSYCLIGRKALNRGGGGALIKFSFQRTVIFFEQNLLKIDKKKTTTPFTPKRKVKSGFNVLRSLKQWVVINRSVVSLH